MCLLNKTIASGPAGRARLIRGLNLSNLSGALLSQAFRKTDFEQQYRKDLRGPIGHLSANARPSLAQSMFASTLISGTPPVMGSSPPVLDGCQKCLLCTALKCCGKEPNTGNRLPNTRHRPRRPVCWICSPRRQPSSPSEHMPACLARTCAVSRGPRAPMWSRVSPVEAQSPKPSFPTVSSLCTAASGNSGKL